MEQQVQNKNTSKTIGAWMIIVGLVLSGFSINEYLKDYKIKKDLKAQLNGQPSTNKEDLSSLVLPKEGYEINATWGNIGPALIKEGVIDKEKFEEIYASNGGLTAEESAILESGTDQKIKITSQNSHFALNMLWAFGLAQQNTLLTGGDMAKYGDYKRFASTGGWTIAAKSLDDIYSKFNWLNLNSDQETTIKNIAENIYRPCCNNSTAFPDCNHGMAALGLIEIMVANGNSETEIYEALKYFNSFWFESSYLEMATYFKHIKGLDWDTIDAKMILSKEYSSSSGWSKNIHTELEKYPELLPKQSEGGGCGV